MDTKVLAICDSLKYATKLMEAFCERKNFGFIVHAFSEVDELVRFVEHTPIEILLISGKNMREELNRYRIERIILLSDGDYCELYEEYETVYKYQSAEHIMKEILCIYAEYACTPMTGMYYRKKEFEVHGVFSPIGRCGKTVLAESLAKTFGKDRRVLLLDLQSYCAQKEQLGDSELWDLADIIYFLRQGKQTFLYKLGSIVKNRENYDYILPMRSTADIKSVTLSEWTELIEKLASDSDYQVVVIDFGQDVSGLFRLLSQCTKVYMPVLSDTESKRKVDNFEWILQDEKLEKVFQIMQKIELPGNMNPLNVRAFMESWTERSVKL